MNKTEIRAHLETGQFSALKNVDRDQVAAVASEMSDGNYFMAGYDIFIRALRGDKKAPTPEFEANNNEFANISRVSKKDSSYIGVNFEVLKDLSDRTDPFATDSKGQLKNPKNKAAYAFYQNIKIEQARDAKGQPVGDKVEKTSYIQEQVEAAKHHAAAVLVASKEFFNADHKQKIAMYSAQLTQSLNIGVQRVVDTYKAEVQSKIDMQMLTLKEQKNKLMQQVAKAKASAQSSVQNGVEALKEKKKKAQANFKKAEQKALKSVIDSIKKIDEAKAALIAQKAKIEEQVTVDGKFSLSNTAAATALVASVDSVKDFMTDLSKKTGLKQLTQRIDKFEANLQKKYPKTFVAYKVAKEGGISVATSMTLGPIGMTGLAAYRLNREYKKHKKEFEKSGAEGSFWNYLKTNKRARNDLIQKVTFTTLAAGFAGAAIIESGATATLGLAGAAIDGKLGALGSVSDGNMFDTLKDNLSHLKESISLSNVSTRAAAYAGTGLMVGGLKIKTAAEEGKKGEAYMVGTATVIGAMAGMFGAQLLSDQGLHAQSPSEFNMPSADNAEINVANNTPEVNVADSAQHQAGQGADDAAPEAGNGVGNTNTGTEEVATQVDPAQYGDAFVADEAGSARSAKSVFLLMGGNKGLSTAQEAANQLINNPANVQLAEQMGTTPERLAHIALLRKLLSNDQSLLDVIRGCNEIEIDQQIQVAVKASDGFVFNDASKDFGYHPAFKDPCILGHVALKEDCGAQNLVKNICDQQEHTPTPQEVVVPTPQEVVIPTPPEPVEIDIPIEEVDIDLQPTPIPEVVVATPPVAVDSTDLDVSRLGYYNGESYDTFNAHTGASNNGVPADVDNYQPTDDAAKDAQGRIQPYDSREDFELKQALYIKSQLDAKGIPYKITDDGFLEFEGTLDDHGIKTELNEINDTRVWDNKTNQEKILHKEAGKAPVLNPVTEKNRGR